MGGVNEKTCTRCKECKPLEAALIEIRDSTYRNALQLRAIAGRALQVHSDHERVLAWREGDPAPCEAPAVGRAMAGGG